MKINVDAQQKYKNKGNNGIHRRRVGRWHIQPHWLVSEEKRKKTVKAPNALHFLPTMM